MGRWCAQRRSGSSAEALPDPIDSSPFMSFEGPAFNIIVSVTRETTVHYKIIDITNGRTTTDEQDTVVSPPGTTVIDPITPDSGHDYRVEINAPGYPIHGAEIFTAP